jgi:GTP-binding protein
LKILGVEFERSAASRDGFAADPLPQVALVGRSNVGKSSLINALTRSRAARTSAAPGKTRLLNLYRVRLAGFTPDRLYLVDLPGYGYARGGAASASAFDALVAEYFAHAPAGHQPAGRRHAGPFGPSATLLVVDARHPGLPVDRLAFDWLNAQGRPLAVVLSKIDKLARAERRRAQEAWAAALDNVPLLPASAATGEGLDELWKRISKLLDPPK